MIIWCAKNTLTFSDLFLPFKCPKALEAAQLLLNNNNMECDMESRDSGTWLKSQV
jgi:hypothetical protein